MRMFTLATLLMVTTLTAADQGESIWKDLLDAPPQSRMTDARQRALASLDKWLARPDSEDTPDCVAYYRTAVDRVISLLRTECPGKGIRVFQLYSSSTIIQTHSGVLAIDLDQGPNEDTHQTPEESGTAFCMTDAQVDALTGLVDYAFYTHEHTDHIDYEVTQALLAKGRTVIAPQSAKDLWKDCPWAEKIVVPTQTLDSPHRIGTFDVDVLCDHQWNNEAHTSGTPCNAYVITLPEGITVAAKGDINCALRFYGWLRVLSDKGRNIDVMVGSPLYWRGVNLAREIDALEAPLWLPGHNWEFSHRKSGSPQGNASPFCRSYSVLHGTAKRGKVNVLSWGEYMDIPPHHH